MSDNQDNDRFPRLAAQLMTEVTGMLAPISGEIKTPQTLLVILMSEAFWRARRGGDDEWRASALKITRAVQPTILECIRVVDEAMGRRGQN